MTLPASKIFIHPKQSRLDLSWSVYSGQRWSLCSGFAWSLWTGFTWSLWTGQRWSLSPDSPLGKEVNLQIRKNSNTNYGLNFKNMSNGVYFIRSEINGVSKISKIIVNH